jgi:hypothetical protein
MEEISRQIYDVLINQEKDISSVKKLSKKLLTTEDEKKYVVLLEGLMYKVFKEEWVKTMLVLGHDPDIVMEKIDEYWDYHESGYYKKDRDKKKDNKRSKDREKYREKGRHHHERGRHYEKGKHRHRHR